MKTRKRITAILITVLLAVGITLNFSGCSKDASKMIGPSSEDNYNQQTSLAKKKTTLSMYSSTETALAQESNYQSWYKEQMVNMNQGGWIQCNHTRLNIPAGALDTNTKISIFIQDKPVEGLPGAIQRDYTFGPSGTVFNKPLTLELSYQGADLNGQPESSLQIYYYNKVTGIWESMGGIVDASGDKVVFYGTINHFSRYALAHSE